MKRGRKRAMEEKSCQGELRRRVKRGLAWGGDGSRYFFNGLGSNSLRIFLRVEKWRKKGLISWKTHKKRRESKVRRGGKGGEGLCAQQWSKREWK